MDGWLATHRTATPCSDGWLAAHQTATPMTSHTSRDLAGAAYAPGDTFDLESITLRCDSAENKSLARKGISIVHVSSKVALKIGSRLCGTADHAK